ncbi:MAG: hypothetical protein AB8G17_15950 [Gammaproteobacteria bacterium]
MLKPRRLHRRATQKNRLYNALRALYADGVRVCTGGRRKPAGESSVAAERPKREKPRAPNYLSLLDESNTHGTDPYNTSRR